MAKQSDGRQAIAKEMASAFETVENSGNVLLHCLAVARENYGSTAIPGKDLKFITDSVSVIRGWSDESAKVRKSECRAVLSQYAMLPEAITLFKKDCQTFDWRDALRLARTLRKTKGNVKASVKLAIGAKTAKRAEAETPTAKQAKGRATAAMNLIIRLPHLSRDFKKSLAKLAAVNGFILNVNRKAE